MSLSVVIAPDSFKGTITATEAARALERGWLSVRPFDSVTLLPQADGGEGTGEAISASVPGAILHGVGQVTGPDGTSTPGVFVQLPDGTAVVELASMSGLPLMHSLDALGASTRGVGQVIREALSSGSTSVIIGLGGSASTDGGTGALTALGFRFLDAAGTELPRGGGSLTRLHTIDRAAVLSLPAGGVTLLTDVTAPLLGPTGAARVFASQKGANAADIVALEAGLSRLATVAESASGSPRAAIPGSGAAGGTAYGLATVWGAETGLVSLEPGSAWIARHSGLDRLITTADVVITGEGSFDQQSFLGKTTGHCVAIAARAGVRCVVIAGRISTDVELGNTAYDTVSLARVAGSPEAAMASPAQWLERAAAQSARSVSAPA